MATATTPKTIAGIQFYTPNQLKEGIFKRYATEYELSRLDRDTLRQFGKEFEADVRKLKKGELVSLIWNALQAERDRIAEVSKELLIGLAPIKAADIELMNVKGFTPERTADSIIAKLTCYIDSTGEVVNYTISTQTKTYLPSVNALLTAYGQWGLEVTSLLRKHYRQVTDTVNKHTQSGVVEKNNNLIPLSESKMLGFIETIKTKMVYSPTKLNWQEVGVALALLTGRRLAELFGEAVFEKVDETTVRFTGQLKVKARGDIGGYEIPVIDADLVIELDRWLEAADRKHITPDRVNKNISVAFSRNKVQHLDIVGLAAFKNTRDAYAVYHLTKHKPNHMTVNAYTGSIMGHSPEDVVTANSYQKYYLVP